MKMERKIKKRDTCKADKGSTYVDILEMETANKFPVLGRRELRVGDLFDKTTSMRLSTSSTPPGFGEYEESSAPLEK